jgi:periplasmic mercuric ion binding protein
MNKPLITLIFAASLVAPAWATVQSATLVVPEMNCPACPITVKKALTKVVGVQQVEVFFEQRELQVTYEDSQTNLETLIQATKAAGYLSELKNQNTTTSSDD